MSKRHRVTRDGYRTEWFSGPRGSREIHVDVFNPDGEKILEWAFPQVAGNSIIGNAAVFLEQAIIYAKHPPGGA